MNRISIIVLVFVLPALVWAEEAVSVTFSVQSVQIQDAVSVRLSGKAQWAFVAEEVRSGNTVAEAGNAKDVALTPASLMKLFVTGAVLERNEKEPFDLATIIAIDGKAKRGRLEGNVIIRGEGNPLLSAKDLVGAVEKLKAEKIISINGDIVVDDSLFDMKGWKSRYEGPAFGMPSALGLDLHTILISVDPATEKVIVEPPNESVNVSFNPSGNPGIRQIDDLTYEITGWKHDATMLRKRFALVDPGLYVGGTFITLLKQSGIKVKGTVRRGIDSNSTTSPLEKGGERGILLNGKSPLSPPLLKGGNIGKEIARIGSRDINAFIRDMNQQSLNVVADNLLFLLGAKTYGAPGTREKGIQAVSSFLSELGVPLTGMVIDDGSGVSDRNRSSAGQMVSFLRLAAKKPWFPAFFDSLERPGIDGRLKDFSYRSERIRAKAGQLPDAFCLAGYIDSREGKKTAFAFMVNGAGPDISQAAPAAAVEVLRLLEN